MDFKEARQAMVDCQLATNNVVSTRVLEAMSTIPREDFLPDDKRDFAYLDEDILIGEGRFLVEPMIIARLIQAAEPQPTDIALDVGSSSGYSAAVLSSLTETVIAVEPHENMRKHACKTWATLDMCNIVDIAGDQDGQISKNAPYDIIVLNGAVSAIPETLAHHLKEESGRMVCVLRKDPKSTGKAVLVSKSSNGNISVSPLFDANIPYLSEFAPKNDFAF